jgi:hypothetical protein
MEPHDERYAPLLNPYERPRDFAEDLLATEDDPLAVLDSYAPGMIAVIAARAANGGGWYNRIYEYISVLQEMYDITRSAYDEVRGEMSVREPPEAPEGSVVETVTDRSEELAQKLSRYSESRTLQDPSGLYRNTSVHEYEYVGFGACELSNLFDETATHIQNLREITLALAAENDDMEDDLALAQTAADNLESQRNSLLSAVEELQETLRAVIHG